jgi:hypothetical protein
METLAKKDILQRIVFTQKIFGFAVRNIDDHINFVDVNSAWRECLVHYCNAPSMDELKDKIIQIIQDDITKNENEHRKSISVCRGMDDWYAGYRSGSDISKLYGEAKVTFYEGLWYCGKEAVKYIRLAHVLGYDFIYRDKHGNTFIHYAAKHGYLTILKALLYYYPQMAKMKNWNTKTPYGMALIINNIKKFERHKHAGSYVEKINKIFGVKSSTLTPKISSGVKSSTLTPKISSGVKSSTLIPKISSGVKVKNLKFGIYCEVIYYFIVFTIALCCFLYKKN